MNLQENSSSKHLASNKLPLAGRDVYASCKLPANHKLCQDSFIVSPNKEYYARMQEDGNFVVYKSSNFIPINSLWCSGIKDKGTGPFHLIMQSDANLVIYDKTNNATWSSGTHKKGKFPCSLCLSDIGNLSIVDADFKMIWEARNGSEKRKT